MKAQFIGIVKGKDGGKPKAAVLNVNVPDALLGAITDVALTAISQSEVRGAEFNFGSIEVEAKQVVFLSVGEILKVGFMQSDHGMLLAQGFNDLGEWYGPINEE